MDDPLEQGRRVSMIGGAINGALAVVKLVAGIAGHSFALVADAVESLGDIFSSALVWGGLTIASRPADDNHPYGHGKAEPLAALAVAALLIGAAGGIAIQAVYRMRGPRETPAPFTLIVLVAVVVIKETLYRYELRTARRIHSTAVVADAWHHRSDAVTSAAAAIGITVALVGGEGYQTADGWAALVACVVICANGVRCAKSAIQELMDTAPGTQAVDRIRGVALEVDGAAGIEKVLVRKMGPCLLVDLHLEVDPTLTVRTAHAIAHDVKALVMKRCPQVADVLVHVEPHADPDESGGEVQSGSSTQTTPSRISAG